MWWPDKPTTRAVVAAAADVGFRPIADRRIMLLFQEIIFLEFLSSD
jgi:hypothetical protein